MSAKIGRSHGQGVTPVTEPRVEVSQVTLTVDKIQKLQFSQPAINRTLTQGGTIHGLASALEKTGWDNAKPPVRVVKVFQDDKQKEALVTLDNRRVWAAITASYKNPKLAIQARVFPCNMPAPADVVQSCRYIPGECEDDPRMISGAVHQSCQSLGYIPGSMGACLLQRREISMRTTGNLNYYRWKVAPDFDEGNVGFSFNDIMINP